ncbi:hypothetical protein GDO86_005448 [Hymenochirus boettgeri]|uniref:Uncharacterized protein n=1 Tax=Hymenochirus boettgeri TaxID=247094 RepID=A0A8T2J9V7_9PIPI|nr:hypothetical protein GDO86_005448 [Hymenochirus boettgeri]
MLNFAPGRGGRSLKKNLVSPPNNHLAERDGNGAHLRNPKTQTGGKPETSPTTTTKPDRPNTTAAQGILIGKSHQNLRTQWNYNGH